MWFLEHYLLTPFDERYLKLPFEYIEYMYLRYMTKPAYEDIRAIVLQKRRDDKENLEASREGEEKLTSIGMDGATSHDVIQAMIKAGQR